MQIRSFARAAAIASIAACAGTLVVSGTATASNGPASQIQKQINVQLDAYPGGVQTGRNEVSYKGGSVKVVFPDPGTKAACTSGWYCFYENQNLTGRTLYFRDCGGNQSLTDYGFGNQTSSYDNTTNHTVEVYDSDVAPFELLWREAPDATAFYVGDANDNRADFFHTYCGV